MPTMALGKRSAVLALAVALAALVPLVKASPARAASGGYAFDANAYGTSATTSLGVGSGRSAYVILSCTTAAESKTNATADATIPGLFNVQGVTSKVTSSTTGGTYSDTATTKIASVSALGNLVQASGLTTTATASEGTGGPMTSGGVSFLSLSVNGTSINASPTKNDTITIPGIAQVVINRQRYSSSSSEAYIKVNAIVITLLPGSPFGPAGASIIIGHALASVSGPVSGLLGGVSYGTSLTGGPVNSGPTFPAHVGCTGTGGSTIVNSGASVSVPPLSAGAITDTAEGTDTATQLSASTSSTVANAAVSGVLSVTGVKVQASASMNGSLQTSGKTTIASLSVLGLTVTLPATIPANYSVTLTGPLAGGTLVLNRQTVTSHGILVQGVYLNLASLGTLVVGSASAYA